MGIGFLASQTLESCRRSETYVLFWRQEFDLLQSVLYYVIHVWSLLHSLQFNERMNISLTWTFWFRVWAYHICRASLAGKPFLQGKESYPHIVAQLCFFLVCPVMEMLNLTLGLGACAHYIISTNYLLWTWKGVFRGENRSTEIFHWKCIYM